MSAQKSDTINVGSRKSQLALIQTNNVIKQLESFCKDQKYNVVTITTTGDKILDTALSKIGEKSLFTKELEVALLDGTVDFVVHSLKDLPTLLPNGLVIGAVCRRDDPRDVVIVHPKHSTLKTLDSLPSGSTIGTSSLRRAAQLKRRYPQFHIKDIRGNLNTRLSKLDNGNDYDAIVLAKAGLERMSWQERIFQVLDADTCLHAVSQGAMAVECRANDIATLRLISLINDTSATLECLAERAFLKMLEGGCSVPVGASCKFDGKKLSLEGGVFSIDGSQAVIGQLSRDIDNLEKSSDCPVSSEQFCGIVAPPSVPTETLELAAQLGSELARSLMEHGATEILAAAKQQAMSDISKKGNNINMGKEQMNGGTS